MSDLGTATGRIKIDTSDVTRAAAEVKRGSQQMTQALNAIGVGVGLVAVKRLGEMAFELAENAAQAQLTREAFNTLAASFGQNADDMLSSMRTASKGMISDANLVLDANRAMLLGVASNADQMGKLLDVARVRGQAMGISTAKAFDDLVTGLGRMSPRILDNLGIVGTQQALDDYAASIGTTADELSDAQKQAILFNAVVASSQTLIDASANAGDNAGTKFQQFGTKIENTKQQLGDFLLAAGATDALDTFSTAIDDSITQLIELDNVLGDLRKTFDSFSQSSALTAALDVLNQKIALNVENTGQSGFQIGNFLQGLIGTRLGFRPDDPAITHNNTATSGPKYRPSPGGGGGTSGPIPVPASVFDPKPLLAAQLDYTKQLADINRNSNRDILSATEDGARQRAEMIRSYDLGIVREEQDFARSRARQQRDYELSIVAIMRDAQKRDAKIRADLDQQIGEARKASDKQLIKLDEDFAKNRARALKDHADNLLEAAGNLDAVAVEREQRNFARQQKDASDAHDEARKDIVDGLQERIEQERKAADEQLTAAREADAQRLEEMQAALALRKADEDEDRKTRQERAAEDQQHALDQQADEQARRIEQIVENAAAERIAQQEAFDAQLAALGLHNLAYEAEQKRAQEQALKDLAPFMADWYKTSLEAMQAAMVGPKTQAEARAGQWPSLLGSPLGASPLGASTAIPVSSSSVSNSNSRTINVHPGAVVVNAMPGTGLNVGQEAIKELALLLRENNH